MPEFSVNLSLVKKSNMIPPSIRKKVIKNARTRLQAIINKIERATQLRFLPRIKVVPFALVRDPIIDLGLITTSAFEDRIGYVIFLSAPALLFVDDDTLTCHILDLFIDYVIMSATELFRLNINPHERGALLADTDLRLTVAKLLVKDERLLRAFHEYITNPAINQMAVDKIAREWLNKGYPGGWIDDLVDIRPGLPMMVDPDLAGKTGHEIALAIVRWLREFRVEG